MKLSIIIPVFNEEDYLPLLIGDLARWCDEEDEILIVDGGSTDNGIAKVEGSVDHILKSKKGRATQMNEGALESSGDLLWFVHADCRLGEVSRVDLEKAIEKGFQWGHFDVAISGKRKCYRVIEFLMNRRARLTRIATGDMGIFVSASLFEKVGGFPDINLMEDIELSKKLRILEPFVSDQRLMICERRWEKYGILKTIIFMWALRVAWFFRVPSSLLADHYD